MKIVSMFFYLLLPVLVFTIGIVFETLIKNKKVSRIIQIATVSILVAFVIGFRSISVGNDTSSYYSSYESMRGISLNQALQISHFEKGYLFITFIFSNMRIPFFLFNFLVSLLLSSFLTLSCYALSKYPCLSIAIYICSGCFTLNMSSVRQTFAMALCFASIYILAISKYKTYFVKALAFIPWVFAIFIHKSSALFIIAYGCMFIKPKKIISVLYFMLTSLLVILFMPSISSQILFSNIKATETYSFFPPRAALSFSGTALMLYLFIIAFYVFYTNEKIKLNLSLDNAKVLSKLNGILTINESGYFNDQIVIGMVFFQYLMYLGEQSISLLARGGLYGGLGLCIFAPNLISKVSKEEKTNLIFLIGVLTFFVAYFAFTTLKDNYLGLIPYGVF